MPENNALISKSTVSSKVQYEHEVVQPTIQPQGSINRSMAIAAASSLLFVAAPAATFPQSHHAARPIFSNVSPIQVINLQDNLLITPYKSITKSKSGISKSTKLTAKIYAPEQDFYWG